LGRKCCSSSSRNRSSAAGDAAPAAEEKSEYDVTLKDAGAQKVAVIKAVKDITQLGLGEAKALVDGAPKVILEKAKKKTLKVLRKSLKKLAQQLSLAKTRLIAAE